MGESGPILGLSSHSHHSHRDSYHDGYGQDKMRRRGSNHDKRVGQDYSYTRRPPPGQTEDGRLMMEMSQSNHSSGGSRPRENVFVPREFKDIEFKDTRFMSDESVHSNVSRDHAPSYRRRDNSPPGRHGGDLGGHTDHRRGSRDDGRRGGRRMSRSGRDHYHGDADDGTVYSTRPHHRGDVQESSGSNNRRDGGRDRYQHGKNRYHHDDADDGTVIDMRHHHEDADDGTVYSRRAPTLRNHHHDDADDGTVVYNRRGPDRRRERDSYHPDDRHHQRPRDPRDPRDHSRGPRDPRDPRDHDPRDPRDHSRSPRDRDHPRPRDPRDHDYYDGNRRMDDRHSGRRENDRSDRYHEDRYRDDRGYNDNRYSDREGGYRSSRHEPRRYRGEEPSYPPRYSGRDDYHRREPQHYDRYGNPIDVRRHSPTNAGYEERPHPSYHPRYESPRRRDRDAYEADRRRQEEEDAVAQVQAFLRQEKDQQERLEKERLEQERIEKQIKERVEKERLEKERRDKENSVNKNKPESSNRRQSWLRMSEDTSDTSLYGAFHQEVSEKAMLKEDAMERGSVCSRPGAFHEKPKEKKKEETGSVSSGGRPLHAVQEDSVYLEVFPGIRERLRRAQETRNAVARDFFVPASCYACNAGLFCIADVRYFICSDCKCVNPLEGDQGFGIQHRKDVGIAFNFEALYEMQSNNVSR